MAAASIAPVREDPAATDAAVPAGDEALVLDLGRRLVPRLLLAGVALVVVGLVVGVLVAKGSADAPEDDAVAGYVIGLGIAGLIVVFGVLCQWAAHRGTGLRLILDREGLHWRSPSRSWTLRWEDTEHVALVVSVWAPPRAAATFGRGERTGRIVVAPRDPDAPAVAEALRRMRTGDVPEPGTHWVTLGTNADWIAAADEALGRLVGERYAGLSERETFRRRYS